MTPGEPRLPAEEAVLAPYLQAQSPPLCSTITLWLVAPHVDLGGRCPPELRGDGDVPYWAFCWAAGQALARFVLDHPDIVRGQRVVDLGAGSGVAAIAAALAGAREVTAVDIDPRARRFAALNAGLSGVEIATAAELPAAWDVLVASDILYEDPARDLVLGAAREGRDVIVSDPLRPGAPRIDLEPMARFEAVSLPDVELRRREVAIYRFRRARTPT